MSAYVARRTKGTATASRPTGAASGIPGRPLSLLGLLASATQPDQAGQISSEHSYGHQRTHKPGEPLGIDDTCQIVIYERAWVHVLAAQPAEVFLQQGQRAGEADGDDRHTPADGGHMQPQHARPSPDE
ncbi:hypothetical protein BCD49_12320 [Pseudofrankia sp. EUN1h]|nr:hypothetical protein BCD49_12320 [Pseudofrankia sp. EUN1h]